MNATESTRQRGADVRVIVVRAVGEALALACGGMFLGLVLEVVMPDGHSHGTPVVVMAFSAVAIPGAGLWACGRIAKQLLRRMNLSTTRWRSVPHLFFALAGTCAALLLAFSLFVIWRALAG